MIDICLDLQQKFGFQRESMRNVVRRYLTPEVGIHRIANSRFLLDAFSSIS